MIRCKWICGSISKLLEPLKDDLYEGTHHNPSSLKMQKKIIDIIRSDSYEAIVFISTNIIWKKLYFVSNTISNFKASEVGKER